MGCGGEGLRSIVIKTTIIITHTRRILCVSQKEDDLIFKVTAYMHVKKKKQLLLVDFETTAAAIPPFCVDRCVCCVLGTLRFNRFFGVAESD